MNVFKILTAHSRTKSFLLPLSLLCLSFCIRLSLISKGPFELDCLGLALNAQQTATTGQLQYFNAAGYPLAVALGAFFIRLTNLFSVNDPIFAVNLMSVCFGSAIVPLQYLLTKNLLNERAALYSAVMLSFIPVLFLQSLFGISHNIFIFFLLLGFYWLTLTPVDHPKSLFLILSGVALGLAASTREQDIVLMLPAIFYLPSAKQALGFPIGNFFLLLLYLG